MTDHVRTLALSPLHVRRLSDAALLSICADTPDAHDQRYTNDLRSDARRVLDLRLVCIRGTHRQLRLAAADFALRGALLRAGTRRQRRAAVRANADAVRAGGQVYARGAHA